MADSPSWLVRLPVKGQLNTQARWDLQNHLIKVWTKLCKAVALKGQIWGTLLQTLYSYISKTLKPKVYFGHPRSARLSTWHNFSHQKCSWTPVHTNFFVQIQQCGHVNAETERAHRWHCACVQIIRCWVYFESCVDKTKWNVESSIPVP